MKSFLGGIMQKRLLLLVFIIVLLASCETPTLAPVTQAPSTPEQVLSPSSATPALENHAADVSVAAKMAGVFYDLNAIQKYYDDGTTAMAKVTVDTTSVSWNPETLLKFAARKALRTGFPNVPTEFLSPLPTSGAMAAPAGACPAAAKPAVTFSTLGGDVVTPQLMADKNLKIIPSKMVTASATDATSLFAKIDSLVNMGDQRLATAQGWNDMLWNQLKKLQQPTESLMDYQLWNASPDIEQQIADIYQARLQKLGAPSFVIAAYNASQKSGWYANKQPKPEDALAKMEIEAVMTGSIQGTVHEQRAFGIPGAGTIPIFGIQTGEGKVTWDIPDLGVLSFEVDILLDKFDEQGRAIGGNVIGIDAEKGYEVRFTFLPDGTKKGELVHNGEVVGQLTMSVNAEKFENYVDVKTNQPEPLPTP
jgi:hypothetical protein